MTIGNHVRQFNQQLMDVDNAVVPLYSSNQDKNKKLSRLTCVYVLCVCAFDISYDVGVLSSSVDESIVVHRCRLCSAVAAASATSQTCSHRPQVSTGNLTSTCQGRFTLTAAAVAVPACLIVS